MQTAIIGGLPCHMQGSVYAAALYSSEFGADFNFDMGQAARDDDLPAFLLRAAWAMARGACDEVAPYAQWVLTLDSDESAEDERAWQDAVEACVVSEMLCRELPPIPDADAGGQDEEGIDAPAEDRWRAWRNLATAKRNGWHLDEIRRMSIQDLTAANILMVDTGANGKTQDETSAAASKAAFWG